MVSRSPFRVEIDPGDLRDLRRALKATAPEVDKELRKRFRDLLEPIAADARGRASWSSRIPGAIGKTVGLKKVGLRVSAAKAPHARPFEGVRGGGSFRHPVFGNRGVWVSQATRPFLFPAAEAHETEFLRAAEEAIDDAARKAGFRD